MLDKRAREPLFRRIRLALGRPARTETKLMDRAETAERIAAIIEPFNTKNLEIDEGTTFAGDLEWDSLTVMDFVAAIEDEWADAIIDELRADETVFRTMLHDVYQNGQVLQGKKYKYLARAYRVFIFGLSLTLIAFVAERFGWLTI